MGRCALPAAFAVLAVIFLASTARAVPLPDNLAIGNTSLSVSNSGIDFFSTGGSGVFDVGATSSGAFAPLSGTTATLTNLNFASDPVNTPISVPNFLTIPSLPQAQFSLTFISPGIGSTAQCAAVPAVGQTCTPPGSPLTLINTPTGTIASFSAQGSVLNTTTAQQTPFKAIFSTEFTGQNFQTVLSTLGTGGLVNAPYSAAISVPTGTFAGTLNAGQPSLSLSLTDINFSPTNVQIGSTSTGAFAALSGTTATLHDLNTALDPVGTPFSLPNFLTIAGHPELQFELTFISPGIFSSAQCGEAPPAIGQTCTLAGSPFDLINTINGVVVSFSAEGIATDTSTLQQTPFEATFTAEFADQSYQSVLGMLAIGETDDASYSVEFAAGPFSPVGSVPEPGSLLLLVSAVSGLWVLTGFGRVRI